MEHNTPLTKEALTDEQQQIVAHDLGPALVFAVAGAGKTTAMVHRMERLVRERIFTPKTILATSFSKAAVTDIQKALKLWPQCSRIKAVTLHSVGNSILTLTRKSGHLPPMRLTTDDSGKTGDLILGRTLTRARRESVPYKFHLETLDREDFLNYVSACKAHLRYADFAEADLSDAARQVASQAEAPVSFPWYLDLYKLYEKVRLAENLLTFDDMLMTGWECLVRFPEVLAQMQGRYRCVLVDEFQDVCLAQSEILDLLTAPHRNYMAIGDDDQTIYEWRGAHTDFLLNFAARYGARQYVISDNFRSHAVHLALANRVIEKNVKRQPKRLSVTRGFGGGVHLHREGSAEDTGVHIAELIQQGQHDGYRPVDMAVLVRLYAQTPFIEHALIERRIPYRIVGSIPFYQRPEVVTLLAYLRLGLLERQLQAGEPLTDEQVVALSPLWKQVANRPTRFISQALSDSVWRSVALHGASLSRSLLVASGEASARVAQNMQKLAADVKWLHTALSEMPAHEVMIHLDRRLDYREFLKASSGFPETGAARAANVQAFLTYAREKGDVTEFLAHMDHISFHRIGKDQTDQEDAIAIMTAFRAKGLQWPVVFVPDCNQGIFPFRTDDSLEEERRLFYVAITRPQEHLHLHVTQEAAISQFLQEADWEETIHAVAAVGMALECEPEALRTQDALALAKHTTALGFERFFQTWWDVPAERAYAVAQKVQRLLASARRRNLDAALGLTDKHQEFWELFGPMEKEPAVHEAGHAGSEDLEFGDLETFVPQPVTESQSMESGGEQATAEEIGVVPEPNNIHFEVEDRVIYKKLGTGTVVHVTGPAYHQIVEVLWDDGRRSKLLAWVAGVRPL